MEGANNIQDELINISPVLAALDRENLYTAPAGYFDQLSVNTIQNIYAIEPLRFNLPELVTAVPDGYFDQLPQSIMSKIKQAEEKDDEVAALLKDLKHKPTYQVPFEYFQQLSDSVINTVFSTDKNAAEETIAISPLVAGISKNNLYWIPAGYFESLAAKVHQHRAPAGKVVSMPFTKAFRYAAAAIFIGVISMAIFKFSGRQVAPVSYAALDATIQKGIKMDDKKFNETLKTLSEDDILQYLEKNSTDEEVAALTSDMEDKTLPAEEDYLLDEKALDNFINAISTQN